MLRAALYALLVEGRIGLEPYRRELACKRQARAPRSLVARLVLEGGIAFAIRGRGGDEAATFQAMPAIGALASSSAVRRERWPR